MTQFKTVEGFPIEVGELYQTRDGRKAFIFQQSIAYAFGVVQDLNDVLVYDETGKVNKRKMFDLDLMRLWPKEEELKLLRRLIEKVDATALGDAVLFMI